MSDATKPEPGGYETVTPDEIMRRQCAATEQVAFNDGPKVFVGSEPLPDGRTRIVLRVGTVRLQAFVDGPRPVECDVAWAAVIDKTIAPDMVVAALDHFTTILSRRLSNGETLDPRDNVFLKH